MTSGTLAATWEGTTLVAVDGNPPKKRNGFHLTRDLGAFFLGAGLLAYEAIIGTDRANLIYAGVALIVAGCFGRTVAARNGEKFL